MPETNDPHDPPAIPTSEWIPHPVSDSSEFLDRDPPAYVRDDEDAPIRLRPVAERDAIAREMYGTDGSMNDSLIQPSALVPLTGDERLADATVGDFWRWALSDLRMNVARGYLVEYLVARALGDPAPARIEWGPWDVQAADGTLVEVKTCGRLQSWASKKLSTPAWTFKSVRAERVWSDSLGDYLPVDPRQRVHVWVFALQTAEDPARYDPLDIGQWEFRVMPHRELLAAGQTSARLSFFDARGVRPVGYAGLPAAVSDARRRNDDAT